MFNQSTEFENGNALSSRIQEHFSLRREQQEKTEVPYQNLSIGQLITDAPLVSSAELQAYFDKRGSNQEQTVDSSVREALESIRTVLNGFPNEKRFFITETINFFENPSQIQKVISALLSISNPHRQQDLLEFIYSTFLTLNKNIETIISSNNLIAPESVHLERGGLYSLSMDIARIICGFFKDTYLLDLDDSDSDIAKVQKAFKNFRFNKASNSTDISHPQVDALITDSQRLKELMYEFIGAIQTHDLLLLYSQKRHLYYRLFLKRISQRIDSAKLKHTQLKTVLAASLLQNSQLDPGRELIDGLMGVHKVGDTEVQTLYENFVDQLSPTTVLDIINDYKQSLRILLHQSDAKTSASNRKTSLKNKIKAFLRH